MRYFVQLTSKTQSPYFVRQVKIKNNTLNHIKKNFLIKPFLGINMLLQLLCTFVIIKFLILTSYRLPIIL